jgi:Asp-tRNA(Asn)/Glu-tRNA(Gln) amidotransferase A subunit family amidase
MGAAPARQDGTGSPMFAMPWTLMGTPALNLPLLANDKGLPIGVQLVGARRHDSRLMRTARWLLDELDDDKGDRQ